MKKKTTKTAKSSRKPQKAASKSAKVGKAAKASPAANDAQMPNQLNPYRVGGGYWASVEALRTLGVGKMHAFDLIIPAVIRAMGTDGFKAFKAKDSRSDKGKDANGRIIQNVAVVARRDYGKPLVECGFCVRFDGRERTAGLFKV